MTITMNINELARYRGARAKSLRQALRYSRRAFAAKHGLKAGTIQSWEDGRYGGLTEQGARWLVNAFNDEGLKVTLPWLLYGEGESPLAEPLQLMATEDSVNELTLFRQQHPNAIDAVITDDGFAPLLLPGDRVAGERYYHDDRQRAYLQVCIVQLHNNQLLVRQVLPDNKPDHYLLQATNPNAGIAKQRIAHQQVISLAPIIWFRRQA